ncbi:single-stranded DNA-binding protein [Nocardia sp. GTS18]|uniref:single-stranded DNA-binding protein n=1 Tax=Nocardia sp. GTS18 TaxID=1778064 RepID=UPI0015EEB36E|nr:single-stranded DNA-binding protein [Nocardia sp. GTS18]
MVGDTPLHLIGNICSDIELTHTPAGVPVANFTVASTPRYRDSRTGEWRDKEALFLRCSLWREPAENAAETLPKGARVIVVGKLKQRSFTTRDGEQRTVIELDVDEIGPSLRFARATLVRTTVRHNNTGAEFGHSPTRASQAAATDGNGRDDPWGTPSQSPAHLDKDEADEPWATSVFAGAAAVSSGDDPGF